MPTSDVTRVDNDAQGAPLHLEMRLGKALPDYTDAQKLSPPKYSLISNFSETHPNTGQRSMFREYGGMAPSEGRRDRLGKPRKRRCLRGTVGVKQPSETRMSGCPRAPGTSSRERTSKSGTSCPARTPHRSTPPNPQTSSHRACARYGQRRRSRARSR